MFYITLANNDTQNTVKLQKKKSYCSKGDQFVISFGYFNNFFVRRGKKVKKRFELSLSSHYMLRVLPSFKNNMQKNYSLRQK